MLRDKLAGRHVHREGRAVLPLEKRIDLQGFLERRRGPAGAFPAAAGIGLHLGRPAAALDLAYDERSCFRIFFC